MMKTNKQETGIDQTKRDTNEFNYKSVYFIRKIREKDFITQKTYKTDFEYINITSGNDFNETNVRIRINSLKTILNIIN